MHRSSAGPLFLASGLGLVTGALVSLLCVVIGAILGPAGADPWLAVAAPLASAMVAAAAAGSVLHWRKVSSRGAVHVGVFGIALVVLLAAQFVRFADTAALLRAGGTGALLAPSTWTAAVAPPLPSLSALGQVTPGVAAATGLFGAGALWVFLVTELALLACLSLWMTGRALAAPLCVACHAWCVRQRGVVERAGNAAPEVVRQRVAARDWRYFRELGPARGGSSLRFDLARCPRCDRSNAVSVMWERPLWRDRCLIGDLRLGSDDMRTLLDLVDGEPKPHLA